MTKRQEEPPINWFPSSTERKTWADSIAAAKTLELKRQQAANAAEVARMNAEIKRENLKAQVKKFKATKKANKKSAK